MAFVKHGNFGSLEPFPVTKRLLAAGIIEIPKAEDIAVPQEMIDQWFKEWEEAYLKAKDLYDAAYRKARDERIADFNRSYSSTTSVAARESMLKSHNSILASNEAYHNRPDIEYNSINNTYIGFVAQPGGMIGVGYGWEGTLQRLITKYRNEQRQMYDNTMMMQMNTLMDAAKREVIANNRKSLDKVLTEKGHLLSVSEKKLLEKFYLLIFAEPVTEMERAEVTAIMSRIYRETPVEQVYTVKPWDENTGLSPGMSTKEPYLDDKWKVDENRYVAETAIKDAARISPLETAFLRAGEDIQKDIQTLSTTTSSGEKSNNNWLIYAGLGFLALKLLRSK